MDGIGSFAVEPTPLNWRHASSSLSTRDWLLLLSETPLHPATIHLQLFGSVDQQSSIDAQVDNLKASTAPAIILGPLSSPDLDQLVFLEKVNPGTIATDVEILF